MVKAASKITNIYARTTPYVVWLRDIAITVAVCIWIGQALT